ncbi:hypothetical protein RclHR1_05720008 [Rhizophagus clarus]|uniref:Uncharacterized protein n=2 Tax=Rhizophagus clarus TaxID=94130 RepID=A0A2Z6S183_9GLOM|nr:hypothetical protein RclHR1_05720008 [Rhizophagus clarus]
MSKFSSVDLDLVDFTNKKNTQHNTIYDIFFVGWALKEKKTIDQQETVKRIKPEIKALMKTMFLNGNIDVVGGNGIRWIPNPHNVDFGSLIHSCGNRIFVDKRSKIHIMWIWNPPDSISTYNIDKWKKMIAQEMYDNLTEYVSQREIDESDIPKVVTIQNWIANYTRTFKVSASLRALEEAETLRNT